MLDRAGGMLYNVFTSNIKPTGKLSDDVLVMRVNTLTKCLWDSMTGRILHCYIVRRSGGCIDKPEQRTEQGRPHLERGEVAKTRLSLKASCVSYK